MANTVDSMLPEVLLRKIIDGTLEELEDDTLETLGNYRFAYSNLERVRMDELKTLGTAISSVGTNGKFRNCPNLNEAYFPKANTARGESIFRISGRNASPLLRIVLPNVTDLSSAFCFAEGVYGAIDLGENLSSGLESVFFWNSDVHDIILRSQTVVPYSITQYGFTPKTYTMIYVPSSLISSYQSATNWSTLDPTIFHAIEGSQYEHYYANGVPIVGGVTSNLVMTLWLAIALRLASYGWEVMANG